MSSCSKSFFTWMNNLNHLVKRRMMHPKSKLEITDKHTHIHTLTRARGNSKLVPLCYVVRCIQYFQKPTKVKLTTLNIIQIFQGILIPFSYSYRISWDCLQRNIRWNTLAPRWLDRSKKYFLYQFIKSIKTYNWIFLRFRQGLLSMALICNSEKLFKLRI